MAIRVTRETEFWMQSNCRVEQAAARTLKQTETLSQRGAFVHEVETAVHIRVNFSAKFYALPTYFGDYRFPMADSPQPNYV